MLQERIERLFDEPPKYIHPGALRALPEVQGGIELRRHPRGGAGRAFALGLAGERLGKKRNIARIPDGYGRRYVRHRRFERRCSAAVF